MTTPQQEENSVISESASLPPRTDTGIGHHAHADFRAAFASVTRTDKIRAFFMLGAAGVTMAVLLLSRLIWLFEPILDKIYYGTLSEIVYYIILGVLFTGYIVGLHFFIKIMCGERIFIPKKSEMDIPRTLGVIAVAAIAVFFTSAGFKFKLKFQVEMGTGVTMATALTNIAVYFYYAFHLWLGLAAAELVQRAMSKLFPAKFTVPWGAIFLVTLYGLLEFIFETTTTSHLYPWLYYLFTYAYAAIYVLTDNSFHLTYWASIIILVI
ncbi:MAG: hypothetical protein J1G01_02765 [Clostridiales bacterium]|nr:hypothetical protein [Clostridiales bacterium]